MSSTASFKQGNKRRDEEGRSTRSPEAASEAGPSLTSRDRYYEYHSDSELELDGDELEADRSATEQERHTAAELTRHMTLITQQSPKHGSAMLKQMLRILVPYFPASSVSR